MRNAIKKDCQFDFRKWDHPKRYTVTLWLFLGTVMTILTILAIVFYFKIPIKEIVFMIVGICFLILMVVAFTDISNQSLINKVILGKED